MHEEPWLLLPFPSHQQSTAQLCKGQALFSNPSLLSAPYAPTASPLEPGNPPGECPADPLLSALLLLALPSLNRAVLGHFPWSSSEDGLSGPKKEQSLQRSCWGWEVTGVTA